MRDDRVHPAAVVEIGVLTLTVAAVLYSFEGLIAVLDLDNDPGIAQSVNVLTRRVNLLSGGAVFGAALLLLQAPVGAVGTRIEQAVLVVARVGSALAALSFVNAFALRSANLLGQLGLVFSRALPAMLLFTTAGWLLRRVDRLA